MHTRRFVTFAPLLALAACTTLPGTSDSTTGGTATGAYMALGTEPFWSLEITSATMRFDEANAPDAQIVVATPVQQTSFNGHRYVTQRMRVDVSHVACSDGMSDRRYADTVALSVDGREFKGCGGTILPPADLSGTSWRMRSIDGKTVADPARTNVAFDGERVTGSAGCNRFSGPYSSDGTRLTAGPLSATRMACPGDAGTQESAALAILGQPMTIHFATDGTMILQAAAGRAIVLERAI